MKELLLLITGILCLARVGAAQEVTPTFTFEDGLYYGYSDFEANRPARSWKDLDVSLVTNPRTWITQVEYIRERPSGTPLDVDQLWGFSIDGVPYIRIPADSIDKQLPSFAGLRITGAICYFQYETTKSKVFEMSAYNPLTGKPFRKGEVERNYVELKEWLLRFADGEIGPFNRTQLIEWTSRDQMIQLALRRLNERDENLEDQMYNLLLSYNKRHPAYIKE